MKLCFYGFILGLLLIAFASCSKRTTERTRTRSDSLSQSSRHTVSIDTSKISAYTRLTGFFPSGKLIAGTDPFIPYPGTGLISGSGETWTPEELIRYLVEIQRMDSVSGKSPFVLERWSTEKKGLSTVEDTISHSRTIKTQDNKVTEKKPEIPWKFGIALIIVAVILIRLVTPRKS